MSIDPGRIGVQSRRRGLLRWWLLLLVQVLGAVALGLVIALVVGMLS